MAASSDVGNIVSLRSNYASRLADRMTRLKSSIQTTICIKGSYCACKPDMYRCTASLTMSCLTAV